MQVWARWCKQRESQAPSSLKHLYVACQFLLIWILDGSLQSSRASPLPLLKKQKNITIASDLDSGDLRIGGRGTSSTWTSGNLFSVTGSVDEKSSHAACHWRNSVIYIRLIYRTLPSFLAQNLILLMLNWWSRRNLRHLYVMNNPHIAAFVAHSAESTNRHDCVNALLVNHHQSMIYTSLRYLGRILQVEIYLWTCKLKFLPNDTRCPGWHSCWWIWNEVRFWIRVNGTACCAKTCSIRPRIDPPNEDQDGAANSHRIDPLNEDQGCATSSHAAKCLTLHEPTLAVKLIFEVIQPLGFFW